MENFLRHLKWCSRKFDKEIILYKFYVVSYGQDQTPLLHFTKIGGSGTTSTLQHFKMSKAGQNYQTMIF
jgi:hypothetical protein